MIINRKSKLQNRVEESFILRYGSWLAMSCLVLLISGCSCIGGYAYVAIDNGPDYPGVVKSYAIDSKTGQLKYLSQLDTGQLPRAITLHPSGKYAYVVNEYSTNISQYKIGPDGKLSPLPKADGSDNLVAVEVDGTLGSAPVSIAITPSGKFAYVAEFGGNQIAQYRIDDGRLSSLKNADVINPCPRNYQAHSITVDPSGKHAYVTNVTIGTVSQYNINNDGGNDEGKLSTLKNADGCNTVDTGKNPYSVTIDHSERFAYVANSGDDTITQYNIGPEGELMMPPNNPPPTHTGITPTTVVITSLGNNAYVPNGYGASVSQYTIEADGKLSPLKNADGGNTVNAGYVPISISVTPSGKFAYVANQETYPRNKEGVLEALRISQFRIKDGELSPLDPDNVIVGYPKQQAASVATVGRNPWWHIW